jgi:hypothetical protein
VPLQDKAVRQKPCGKRAGQQCQTDTLKFFRKIFFFSVLYQTTPIDYLSLVETTPTIGGLSDDLKTLTPVNFFNSRYHPAQVQDPIINLVPFDRSR